MRILCKLLLLFIVVSPLFSKSTCYFGAFVLDNSDNRPMIGAHVKLTGLIDTNLVCGAVTNKHGYFHIENIKKGMYTVSISYVGYKPIKKDYEVRDSVSNYKFYMEQTSAFTDEIVITAHSLMGENKGDTLVYNGNYFRSQNDESAEDLLKKMPGVEISDDGIKVQNNTISQVLVNGKPFPIANPNDIYKLFPANKIKQIQLFNKQSKQEEFQGIKKDDLINTINIVTEDKNMYFGDVESNFTDDKKININPKFNAIKDDFTLTASAEYNNGANEYHYVHDKSQYSKSLDIGSRFDLEHDQFVHLNYRYDGNGRETSSQTAREYFSSDTFKLYGAENYSKNNNTTHQVILNSDFDLDTNNSVSFSSNFRYSYSDNKSLFESSYKSFENILSSKSSNHSVGDDDAVSFNTDLLIMHKFKNPDRKISLNIECDNSNTQNNSNQNFTNDYFITNHTNDSTLKNDRSRVNDFSSKCYLKYTEPLLQDLKLQVNIDGSYRHYKTDKKAYNIIGDFGEKYIDSNLSKKEIDNSYIQNCGLNIDYNKEKIFSVSIGANYKYKYDLYDNSFPESYKTDISYNYIDPEFRGTLFFSKSTHMSFNYATSRDFPTYQQLQSVVDNSNPLSITTGNPDLKTSQLHNFNLSINSFNIETMKGFFGNVSLSIKQNSIINSTIFAKNDTTIDGDIKLPAGSQFSMPVNRDGNKNISCYTSLIYPLDSIKTRLGIGVHITYSENPTIYNNSDYLSKSLVFGTGANIYGAISDKGDYRIDCSINSSQSKYVYTDYNTITASCNANFQYTAFKKLKINFRLRSNYYLKQNTVNNKNSNILNFSLAYKFFDDKLEAKLTVYDLLNQYIHETISVNSYYTEHSLSNTSKQYIGLSLKYKINDTRNSTIHYIK